MNRLFDFCFSLLALLLLWPLMLLIALAVSLDSRGPSIFRQQRIGRGMRPFVLFKFRTMRAAGNTSVISFDDSRVTRLGLLLRRTKLDELPQLIDILGGEMSFVGPRPEFPAYVEQFAGENTQLLIRRPGLTDPASIAFRDEAALLRGAEDAEQAYVGRVLPQKLRLSLDYLRRRTLGSDLIILAQTARALLN